MQTVSQFSSVYACACVRVRVQVHGLFGGYIQAALAEAARDPGPNGQGWRAKDCAVYMVLALQARVRVCVRVAGYGV